MTQTYRIFINGAYFNGSDSYEYAMNRALGIAMYKGMEFVNTRSTHIMDKWVKGNERIIITKNEA